LDEGNLVRFQCHVGHIYSFESLLVDQADHLERALWVAVRSLSEKAALARQMLDMNRGRLSPDTLARYQEQADAAQENVDLLTKIIESGIFSPQTDEELADQAAEDEAGPRH
jgi:two-component system chemotaxis response regulator CheB